MPSARGGAFEQAVEFQ
uniref:Uncharacterized protein n=1 Tax=Anopheles albimanus TaxID=7167 RepID=A0A182FXV3_ANOAL